MIKRTQHNLSYITAKKRELLDSLFVEYQRVVNEFIVLYWNSRLLFGRLSNRCQENRILMASVESEYTSQKCSTCGEIHKESRKGERYECKHCGASLDADYNASLNILNRFLDRKPAVSYEQQQHISLHNFG